MRRRNPKDAIQFSVVAKKIEQPQGYIWWHEWAEKMAKSHPKQLRCPDCGLFTIWNKKAGAK